MDSESPGERETHTSPNARRVYWLWVGASAVGISVGAVLAVLLFPSVAFGRRPAGPLDWKTVGFALAVGVPLGLSQWLVLRHVLKSRVAGNDLFLKLWTPVTSVGIAAMILPLYWTNAEGFLWLPFLVAYPMFPGMLLLGFGQWLLLDRLLGGRLAWVLQTIVGAAVGAMFGLFAALSLIPFPFELAWGFVTGAMIGLLQGKELVLLLATHRNGERHNS